ncbi:MAG: hypothetical protein EOP77_00270 [Variovorax sp.]|nr:MAG: hypothetical protein EOP77_00270 [Variovorax sp.]
MTAATELPDDELRQQAIAWRRLALQGVQHARGYAHEYEVELRRRDGSTTSGVLHAASDTSAKAPRWWWPSR